MQPPLKHLLLAAMLWLPMAAWANTATLGAEDDAHPWSNADGTGYANDVVRAAYQAVGWEVRFEVLPYPRCKQMAERGALLACFSASKTPLLEKKLQYPAVPVFVAQNILYAPSDSSLAGCDHRAWPRKMYIGLINGYEYHPAVEALQASGAIGVVTTTSEVLALRMLEYYRFDAALITVDAVKRIELIAKIAKVNANYKVVCDFGGLPAYVAFSRRHPQATAALSAYNKGMTIITQNGTITRLQKQWASTAMVMASAKRKVR